MSKDTLFRDEAVLAHSELLLGRPACNLPVPTSLLVYLLSALALLAVSYVHWGRYTRRVTVIGVVQPAGDVLRLYPPQASVVSQRHVQEGSRVSKGALLFTLNSERQTALGPTQGKIAESLALRLASYAQSQQELQRLTRLQAQDLALRRRLLESEIMQGRHEQSLLQRRLAFARTTQQRFAALATSGFVSSLQLQQKEEESLDAERSLSAQSRVLDTLQREHAALDAELQMLPLRQKNQQTELQRLAQALQQEVAHNEGQREVQLMAPEDGVISAVRAEVGAHVTPQQSLAMLVPQRSQMEVHLFAPSKAIGFIRVGARVKLRLEAFPYQKFGHVAGSVTAVGRTALQPDEMRDFPEVTQPMYRIRVKLAKPTILAYGVETPLIPSMRLEGDLMLETRRLYEWALEPLYSVSGKW